MGHKYTREQILEEAVALTLEQGLGALTFRRLAVRLGTSDRVIVYYFANKSTLVAATLTEIGNRLQEVLAQAFSGPSTDHRQLVKKAYPVLAQRSVDPVFAVYFEACGLAAAGVAPFKGLAAALVQGWIDWLSTFFTGTAGRRRSEAEATLALLDGILLMRQLGGAQAAARAARALGAR